MKKENKTAWNKLFQSGFLMDIKLHFSENQGCDTDDSYQDSYNLFFLKNGALSFYDQKIKIGRTLYLR